MEQLVKMYEALDLLKQLGLTISPEQISTLKEAENKYVQEEIIPAVKASLEPLIEKLHCDFSLKVIYKNEEGLTIEQYDQKPRIAIQAQQRKRPTSKYILKVTFPNGEVVSDRKVSNTLQKVVEYAGVERVAELDIPILGVQLVSKTKTDNPRYMAAQYDMGDGWYLMTCSTTDVKFEQIKFISSKLGLGLRLEKVLLERPADETLWEDVIEAE